MRIFSISVRLCARYRGPQARFKANQTEQVFRLRVRNAWHVCPMQFYQLAKGAQFEFDGRKFEKIGMSNVKHTFRRFSLRFQGRKLIG